MNIVLRREEFRLKTMATLVKGANKVLDVGLYFPNYYLKDYCSPKAQIIGLDIIKAKLPKGYSKVVVGDINKLDQIFPKDYFDAILLGELIEHLEEPHQALRQCYKALRKGGLVVISTPNPLSLPRFFFELLLSKRYFYHQDHKYEFLPRWLIKMVEKVGFKIQHKGGIAFLFPIRLPYLLADQVIIVAKKV